MDNVTFEKLKKTHGAEAESVFNEIAHLGGWGNGKEYQDSPGGLDIKGLEDGAAKTKILALLGVKVEDETPESLVKSLSKEKLLARAKEAGLDGNEFTDKKELAAAILEKEKENK